MDVKKEKKKWEPWTFEEGSSELASGRELTTTHFI